MMCRQSTFPCQSLQTEIVLKFVVKFVVKYIQPLVSTDILNHNTSHVLQLLFTFSNNNIIIQRFCKTFINDVPLIGSNFVTNQSILVYSKTSEQQPVLGTNCLTFVERVASLRGFLEYYANYRCGEADRSRC